jgi:hypothetical protein
MKGAITQIFLFLAFAAELGGIPVVQMVAPGPFADSERRLGYVLARVTADLTFRFVRIDGPGFEDVAAALAEEDEAVAHPAYYPLNGTAGKGSVSKCDKVR